MRTMSHVRWDWRKFGETEFQPLGGRAFNLDVPEKIDNHISQEAEKKMLGFYNELSAEKVYYIPPMRLSFIRLGELAVSIPYITTHRYLYSTASLPRSHPVLVCFISNNVHSSRTHLTR